MGGLHVAEARGMPSGRGARVYRTGAPPSYAPTDCAPPTVSGTDVAWCGRAALDLAWTVLASRRHGPRRHKVRGAVCEQGKGDPATWDACQNVVRKRLDAL